jgi:hypothetical protein
MDAFLSVLALVWIILGFFLIPFNLNISNLLAFDILKVDWNTWQRWRKRVYAFQFAWNLLFFGLGIGYTVVHKVIDRVTFAYQPSGSYSDWRFYCNGKLLDDDESSEASPFQRAYAQSISRNPFGRNAEFKLDPEGLHESDPEYYAVAFSNLPVEEQRAYIEKYNRDYSDLANPAYLPTCLLVWVGFSVAAPFWPMVFEALGIIAILFPWLFLFCFGPTLWTVMRSLGFIGRVTSLFRDI